MDPVLLYGENYDYDYDPFPVNYYDPGAHSTYKTSYDDPGAFDLGDVVGGFGRALGGMGRTALNFAQTPQGLLSILAALAAAADRRRGTKPSGGGVAYGMSAPRQLAAIQEKGAYGPIMRYAAEGGLMHAYAHGGHVNMEDGGFVLTKRAVDGAGGPRGLAALVPGAQPIRGPGTGTSDSIPATIHGAKGQTPARVSNGEAYVPREAVQRMGGARQMYNLMNNLQRRA